MRDLYAELRAAVREHLAAHDRIAFVRLVASTARRSFTADERDYLAEAQRRLRETLEAMRAALSALEEVEQ